MRKYRAADGRTNPLSASPAPPERGAFGRGLDPVTCPTAVHLTSRPTAACAYYQRATGHPSARTIEDESLTTRIVEVCEANYCAYGYRRMWKAFLREGIDVGVTASND